MRALNLAGDARGSELRGALERRRRRTRLTISLLLVSAAGGGAAAALLVGAVGGGWPATLVIIGAIAVSSGALIRHVGQKRVWAGIVAIGVVLGIAVAVHELVSSRSQPTPPKAPAQTP